MTSPEDQTSRQRDGDDQGSYILSKSSVEELNFSLIRATAMGLIAAGPAALAWSILLQHLKCLVSGRVEQERQGQVNESTTPQSSAIDAILDIVQTNNSETEIISELANNAVHKMGAFDVIAGIATAFGQQYASAVDFAVAVQARLILLDLIRLTINLSGYKPEIVAAALAILGSEKTYWDVIGGREDTWVQPARVFLRDAEILMPSLLRESQLRFPYELLPYLKLTTSLLSASEGSDPSTSPVWRLLADMPSFTQTLPVDFKGYLPAFEDDNPNYVKLTQDLEMFSNRKDAKTLMWQLRTVTRPKSSTHDDFMMPPGTQGYIIGDLQRRVITWSYTYSCIRYLPFLLSTFLAGADMVDSATQKAIDRDAAGEIITLFTYLVHISGRSPGSDLGEFQPRMVAMSLLEEASDGLGQSVDLITLVSGIFDQELQTLHNQQDAVDSLELLVRCVQFFHSLMLVCPERVWLVISRSPLLNGESGGAPLALSIVSAEMLLDRNDFLQGCVHVFEAMVEDAVAGSVSRRTVNKAVTRFQPPLLSRAGLPENTMGKILLSFAKVFLDIFQSSSAWKSVNNEKGQEVLSRICGVFEKILHDTYGYDDTLLAAEKINRVLFPSAEYLVKTFLSSTDDGMAAKSLISNCMSGIAAHKFETCPRPLQTPLTFISLLFRVGIYLDIQPWHLENELLGGISVLIRLLGPDTSHRRAVISVLESLVKSANRRNGEPPSLLGYMGNEIGQAFLALLSELGGSLDNEGLEIAIWDLLSAFVTCRQQWFSVSLLGGATPRYGRKANEKSLVHKARTASFLALALDEASELQALSESKASAALGFIAVVQNFLPWTSNQLRKHPRFLLNIVDYTANVRIRCEAWGK